MRRKFRVALEGERYLEEPQQRRAISFEVSSGTAFQPTLYDYSASNSGHMELAG
jgi:hypothetical protein